MKEVDLLYNDYIRVMTCMHERIRNIYNTYVTKFLDENTRKENAIEPETNKLVLPGEVDDPAKIFENPSNGEIKGDDEEIKEDRLYGQMQSQLKSDDLIKNGNRNGVNLREEDA